MIKKGIRNGVTRYRCTRCGKSHSSTRRTKHKEEIVWSEYVHGKQTRNQLSKKFKVTTKTVERLLDTHTLKVKEHNPRVITAIFDATFFGRKNGALVVRDPNKHENLHAHEIHTETKSEYYLARHELEKLGYTFQAVVLDGKRGIAAIFNDIPVQICQFHQWKIVVRKLTTRPKLPSHQLLLSIAGKIAEVDEKRMVHMLAVFAKEHHNDLNEKVHILGTNRSRHIHLKLRSAYLSLLRNLPFLFTYQKYPELNIPNTTNSLDGYFSVLKMMVNVHRGLTTERRIKVVKEILGC